ncbi:MAG: hypothetical protein HY043_15675 [Verrucomicrobia bacterium]|nr:hypothetical protein [Verrucomicrobiota bacterium]
MTANSRHTGIGRIFAQLLAFCAFSAEAQLVPLSPHNVVQNASFENFTGFPNMASPWSGFGELDTGWWGKAPDGGNFAHLDGYIFQSLTTVPGQSYQLSFFSAADLFVSPSATVSVTWAGQIVASFATVPHDYDPMQNRTGQIMWEKFSTTVVAETSPTILGFSPLNGTQFYLDNVEAIPIPEPESSVLFLFGAACIFVTVRLRRVMVSVTL